MSVLRRTRVLAITDSLEVGGAERVAVDIANSLDRERHDVLFCATRLDGPLREVLAPDIEVEVIGRRATWDLPGMARFAAWVRDHDIDVLHSHGRGTMKFVALARSLGLVEAKHVFHDHFGWLHIDRGASRGLRAALHRGVDAYIGVDERLCTWARTTAGLPADRVNLVRGRSTDGDDETRVVARGALVLPSRDDQETASGGGLLGGSPAASSARTTVLVAVRPDEGLALVDASLSGYVGAVIVQ